MVRSRYLGCGHHLGGVGGRVSARGTWGAVRALVTVIGDVVLVAGGGLAAVLVARRKSVTRGRVRS